MITILALILNFSPFFVSSANAQKRAPNCPDSGCIGGMDGCAYLPNGVLCLTTIPIIVSD